MSASKCFQSRSFFNADLSDDFFFRIDVNGDNTHPVYAFLKKAFPGDVTWNFASRFLVDHNGIPVHRFETESHEEIENGIIASLEAAKAAAPSGASASVSSSS